MTVFLTSTTRTEDGSALNPANGFAERLRRAVKDPCRTLFICSDPEHYAYTDSRAEGTAINLRDAGIRFSSFEILDGRNRERAKELVQSADLMILSGGHVPTQNRFFAEIGLAALLKDFPGVIVGISAGTMNSARIVYAHPEEPGEAVDPAYQRFLPGLGLTETMILPHYQLLKDETLDGLRLFEDIAYPDSMGRCFYALPDGSYFLMENGIERLFGEAYRIENGKITRITGGETP